MKTHSRAQALFEGFRLLLPPIYVVSAVVFLGMFLFMRGKSLIEEQLKERLRSTAAVAAFEIEPEHVARVREYVDRDTPEHRHLVDALQRIRETVPNIRYAYLMRLTDHQNVMAFIADADEALSAEKLDFYGNQNGRVDPDEAPGRPGEYYPIDALEAFQSAFTGPTVDDRVTVDRWGATISGYAPVRDDDGNVVAILGLDMSADDYEALSSDIFSPVGVLLALLTGLFIVAYTMQVVQRRRQEAQVQLETDRSALMDLATHQLGMPLATFKWWVEIMRDRDGETPGRDSDAIEQMQIGINRMDEIIRSLRSAIHLQDGTMQYLRSRVSLKDIIESVAKEAEPLFGMRKQRLVIELPKALPDMRLDRDLIHGVLQELIENARTYSAEGSTVTVRVQLHGSNVRIDVEDHGCGIPAADLPTIFNKFVRASNAAKVKPVGNGLGLFIAKGIIEKAGGSISIRSKESVGTTVSLTLPIA